LDLTDLSSGLKFEGGSATDIVSRQFNNERNTHMGLFYDLQSDLRKAIGNHDQSLIKDLVHYSAILAQEPNGGKANVNRILWKLIIEAPVEVANLMLNSLTTPFDFNFVDDINGRTCLHEAAMSGTLRLVNMCLEKSSHRDKVDVYGRSPLHYAAMRGHAAVCRRLLEVKLPPNALDVDNCTPLVYATMKGSADCVSVLLKEAPVEVGVLSPGVDLSPLSLASQSGHVDVVVLLLQHEAKSLPNSNGEYPIHLAAREGHIEVCGLLLQHSGWDVPDKYHEWTPLFHAARNGHNSCVEVLLEAGSRVNAIDELGYSAVHYAAWYGHHACVARLHAAAAALPHISDAVTVSNASPLSDVDISSTSSDIDHIPSLSLPPPIMPHRTYGHNYLDRRYLVQVSLGVEASPDDCSGSLGSGVRLHSRLNNLTAQHHHLPASNPLKLVMSAGSDANCAPYSISLPQRDAKDVFVFQIPSLDLMSLTFSVYPNFGTKTIGRAVALPSLFIGIENNSQFVLPILDHRLHVVGEVSTCL
jgi:CDK inhibitor PHO81